MLFGVMAIPPPSVSCHAHSRLRAEAGVGLYVFAGCGHGGEEGGAGVVAPLGGSRVRRGVRRGVRHLRDPPARLGGGRGDVGGEERSGSPVDVRRAVLLERWTHTATTDGRTDGGTDGQTDRQAVRNGVAAQLMCDELSCWNDGRTPLRRTDGRTEGQTGRQTDRQ